MATVQITTWDEFKTALTESITEDTTYEIMNDIDVSDTVISNTITIPTSNFTKTFNGNGHDINGITSYSAIGIFQKAASCTIIFNNTNFTNVMLQTGYLFYFNNPQTGSYYPLTFNECLFNGLTLRLFSNINSGYACYTYLNRCSINVECTCLTYGSGYYFTECYIIINPIQGTSTCSLDPRSSNSNYIHLANCYIAGSIYISYNTSAYIVGGTYYNASTCYNNVFNYEVHITNYSESTTYYWTGGNVPESRCSLYNSEKVYGGTGTDTPITCGTRTNFDGLTDTQLKSRTYIKENTSFPLYG